MEPTRGHSLDWQDLIGLESESPDLSQLQHNYADPDQFTQSNNQPTDGGARISRPRNRNPRSCDFCRMRKTACVVEAFPPCKTCRVRGLQCTFQQRRRGRLQQIDASGPSTTHDGTILDYSTMLGDLPNSSLTEPADAALSWQVPPNALDIDGMLGSGIDADDRERSEEPRPASSDSDDSETHRNAMVLPLDQPSWTYVLLGGSGEGDPHLLKRSTLAIHADNVHYRRFHRDSSASGDLDNQRPIVFMLGRDSLYDNYEPRIDDRELQTIRTELGRVPLNVGVRLVGLYFKYIYPSFPVLSRFSMLQNGSPSEDSISSLPLSLKAALYASALPYMMYDDLLSTMLDVNLPTAKELYRMSWTAITQEIHIPRLSTIQSCLLLLQRDIADRYVQASPFQWSLLAWSVSLSQALGLSTDCSTVRGMPTWEKRLRKRLWWAMYVMDKWNFSSSGLCSHIHKDDFDVLPLTDDDCSTTDEADMGDGNQNLVHFRLLVELSVLLSDTTNSFFTIRACKETGNDFARTCDLANNLQSRLYAWKVAFDASANLKPSESHYRTRLDGNASLGLAYWAVHLLIHRAILRSTEAVLGTEEDKRLRMQCRESARLGAETCCKEVVDFVDQLQAGAWNAFWHKFSPSNFAIVSSVMMRLLVTSESPSETSRLDGLIDRWRWVLRSGGGNIGTALMSLGLLRLDRTLLKASRNYASNTS